MISEIRSIKSVKSDKFVSSNSKLDLVGDIGSRDSSLVDSRALESVDPYGNGTGI